MNTRRSSTLAVIISLSLLLPLTPTLASYARPIRNQAAVSGLFLVLWNDPQPADLPTADAAYLLRNDAGRSIRLYLSADLLRFLGDVLAFDRRRVTVAGRWLSDQAIEVESVRLDPAADPTTPAPDDIVGPQPWVSVLCKFADVPAEPQDQPYFEEMYSSAYPGLDHHWREESFDIANVTGSAALGWYVLPQPRSYYV